MKKLFIVSLLVLGATSVMYAQSPKVVASDKTGWHKIGETTVDFTKESDEIAVIGADRFAKLKIRVTEAPIRLESFDIYFENEEKQDVKIASEIKAPGETRTVDLNGGERNIKKVVFVYKTVSNKKDEKAHVELWGLKTNEMAK